MWKPLIFIENQGNNRKAVKKAVAAAPVKSRQLAAMARQGRVSAMCGSQTN